VLLMFASGLNLLGVFEVGHGLAGAAGTAAHRLGTASLVGSFGNGVLATVVATPCTAPFMGPAVGYALAAPTAVSLTVFTGLGLGMAAPYVLLSIFPAWLKRMPQPGPWMETFKHVMAFPMFAVALWWMPAFGKQVGVLGLTLLLVACLLAGLGAWLYGRFGAAWRGPVVRNVVGRGLAGLFVVAGLGVGWNAAHRDPVADAAPPEGWIAWRPGIETRLRAEGRVVLLDFTADWCPTCKANDKLVLSTEEVESAARRLGVARVQADWTVKSGEIKEALASFGRESVPLYVVLSPDRDRPPEKLPTVITPAMVVDALERAAARQPTASPDVPR
jgi:thiol:disulfide interchange protein DsbD